MPSSSRDPQDLAIVKGPCDEDKVRAEEVLGFIRNTLGEPTPIQRKAIPLVLKGINVLIMSPPGTGKTEAALLPILFRYVKERGIRSTRGIGILYITPLRALNRDILTRISNWCSRFEIRYGIRHGDTPRSVRRMQSTSPPELLVTTPETLQIMLGGSRLRRHLEAVRYVIVDEVHDLAESKRGIQLSLGLARLRFLAGRHQLVMLSATVSDPDLIIRLFSDPDDVYEVVEAKTFKEYTYLIEYPVPTEEDYELATKLAIRPNFASRLNTMLNHVQGGRACLIFANCREHAEIIGAKLGMLGVSSGVHHSSLSADARRSVEEGLKKGNLKCIVCTSSLELGIDVGKVDLIIQYSSPRRVTSLLQRVGRSGHRIGLRSKGVIITRDPDDFWESLAIVRLARLGKLERIKVHEGALDVLAHQILGIVLDNGGKVHLEDLYELVKRTFPFRHLSRKELEELIRYMGRLGLIRFRDAHIWATRRTRRHYFVHASMIPEELVFPVYDIITGEMIAHLGEDFFSEYGKPGVKLILKGRPWIITSVEGFKVFVKPIEDYLAAVPGWEGEVLPTSWNVAREVGRLRRWIELQLRRGRSVEDIAEELTSRCHVRKSAVIRALRPLEEHVKRGYPMPSDKLILVERFADFIVVHACFGHGVNRALAVVLSECARSHGVECITRHDAYRILLMLKGELEANDVATYIKKLNINVVLNKLRERVDAYVMRHIAIKFGAIPKNLYYKSASYLLSLPQRLKGTPIEREAFRTQLIQHYDIDNLKEAIRLIRRGSVKVEVISIHEPSPLTRLMLSPADMLDVLVTTPFSLKEIILNKEVTLVCMDCLNVRREVIRALPERVSCPLCGSNMVSLLKWRIPETLKVLAKRKKGEKLNEEEEYLFVNAEMSAELVAIHGKKAIMAMSVRGVGPLTAYKLLAKRHEDEEELFRDLMEAMREYMETREYWTSDEDLRR